MTLLELDRERLTPQQIAAADGTSKKRKGAK
jgi:hypothetical protein